MQRQTLLKTTKDRKIRRAMIDYILTKHACFVILPKLILSEVSVSKIYYKQRTERLFSYTKGISLETDLQS